MLSSSDRVNLQTGGAIIGGGVDSSLEATLTNSVDLGAHGSFRSAGNIGAGTYTMKFFSGPEPVIEKDFQIR